MTNEEILGTPEALLGALERQRKAMLQIAQIRRPCPVCGAHASLLEAGGITVNQYAFGNEPLPYACAKCGSRLEQVVPLLGGQIWFWKRKDCDE